MDDKHHTAYIAIGSNIDPGRNIVCAVDLLKRRMTVTAASRIFVTAPISRPAQALYRNGVVSVRTCDDPRVIKFETLRRIEGQLGRRRLPDKFASRTIDLDLLMWNDAVMNENGLVIPDPDIRTREYLAAGLWEIAPDLYLPDDNTPLAKLTILSSAASLEVDASLTEHVRSQISE